MIYYLIILSFAFIYAIIRSEHDKYLRESVGNWKRWAMVEAGFITLIISGLMAWNTEWLLMIPFFFIFGLSFWIIFDFAIGVKFGDSIFYLGSGRFDNRMRKIFINGFAYTVFKLVWFSLFTGLYFEMIKN